MLFYRLQFTVRELRVPHVLGGVDEGVYDRYDGSLRGVGLALVSGADRTVVLASADRTVSDRGQDRVDSAQAAARQQVPQVTKHAQAGREGVRLAGVVEQQFNDPTARPFGSSRFYRHRSYGIVAL